MDTENNNFSEGELQNCSLFINSNKEDKNINKLIELYKKRQNEMFATIAKYELQCNEIHKELKLNETLISNSFIADFNLNYNEQYNLQKYALDVSNLINCLNMKTNKLKYLIINDNKEVIQQLNKFKEKQNQNRTSSTTIQSFNIDQNEYNNNTIVPDTQSTHNFLPTVNSTVQESIVSSTVIIAPVISNNQQTNENFNTTSENDKIECEPNHTVVANLKSSEPLKPNKTFKCEICKKFYSSQSKLEAHHTRYHEKSPKKYACEICGKSFQKLTLHKKIHDKNRPKPYACQQCDYATDVKPNFQRHQKSHELKNKRFDSIQNPLKCEKCPTLHRNKKYLLCHMFQVHPKDLFQCDLCGNQMKNKTSIKKHILKHKIQ